MIKGVVDPILNNQLRGWIMETEDLHTTLTIDIYINSQFIKSVKCNYHRKDILDKKLHPTGNIGFEFDLAPYIKTPNSLMQIDVIETKTKKVLNRSPKILDLRGYNNRILIVGINKSGTSILTYRIAKGLKNAKIHFEPLSKNGLNDYNHHIKLTNKSNVVTKCLYYSDHDTELYRIAQLYDKKIWIIRDPRDVVISSFLYKWYKGHRNTEEKFKLAYNRLKQKERNPHNHPFTLILKGLVNLESSIRNQYQDLLSRLTLLDKSWLVIKYEDLIDNNLESLNTYLGFEVDQKTEVRNTVERVARSKSYGNWRNWFTESELEKLKHIFNPIMLQLGYDKDDWKLNKHPYINPAQSSEYIYSLFYS